ncbi:hypothetical protein OM076_27950 [Solirubrobacter ginsenosidimutans]|uniref:Plastocyanin-like domain-containing protein n=1 Tax=Solirubrobacter ginsenosidimutans TaxID=490573 RepID=A0A9X3MWN2_9ACTN|nr:hypothetical protein [Solirubrobacter ginsenosidimutans]MDA0164139.1 hypothetical protein [Solirubrobacter ginsenosidimutans]
MLRATVVFIALVAALIGGAPAAFAQAPEPSVSTTYGSATPAYLSGTESPRSGAGPTVIKDGFGLNPPTLMADPGSVVTITLADDADAVVAFLGAETLPVAPAGEHAYAVTVPAGAVLPQSFAFRVESSGERTLLTDSWVLQLGPEPAQAAAPEPTPAAVTPAPVQGPAVPTSLRLRGARLAVVMRCPVASTGGCEGGSLTLKWGSRRVARIAVGRLPAGASTTARTHLAARLLRQLRRHRVRTLRGTFTPVSGAPVVVGRLALR